MSGLTSVIEDPIKRGNEAITTAATRQLNLKAMKKAVAVRAVFWTIVDRRSARALLTNVASAANIEVKYPVLFSSKSNHPISLVRIAANLKEGAKSQ